MTNSIRKLLKENRSLLLPIAHDALTAKLIELAGFKAYSIGGFGVAASAYAKPDNGSVGFKELYPVFKNIIKSSSLPVLIDADTGYGGPKRVAGVVKSYEDIGASAIFIEDQVWPKKCGHTDGHKLVSIVQMQEKIRAAKSSLKNKDTILMTRTDARSAEGNIEAAIKRAKAYIKAGADAIFIEAPQNLTEVKLIPKKLPQTILLINMMEGGKTPIIPLKTLEAWGYQLVAYPITGILSQTEAIKNSLNHLMRHGSTNNYFEKHMTEFSEFRQIIGL